jgi:hypothetical protein
MNNSPSIIESKLKLELKILNSEIAPALSSALRSLLTR